MGRHRTLNLIAGFVLLLVLVLSIESVRAREVVRLVASESCPYICSTDRERGFLADITIRIFNDSDIDVELSILPYKRALHMVESGQVDGIIGILKRQAIDLVFPDEAIGQRRYSMYVNSSDPWLYSGFNSIYMKKIGVQGGVSYGLFDSYIKKYADNEQHIHRIFGANATHRLSRLLATGRLGMFIEDTNIIDYLKKEGQVSGVKAAGYLPPDNIYIAFSPDKGGRLPQMVSDGVAELRASGALGDILSSYGMADWQGWRVDHDDPFAESYLKSLSAQVPLKKDNVDLQRIRFEASVKKGSGYWFYAQRFKELLELYSNGSMSIELFFGDKSEHDIAMEIAEGHTQMGMIAINNVAPFAPSLGVFTLPYLFPDAASAKAVFRHKKMQQIAERSTREANLRSLSFFIGGYRLLANSQKQVRASQGLKGLKIRVPQNQAIVESFRAWGVEPYPVPWPDVYPLLESGRLHGQENPVNIMVSGVGMEKEIWSTLRHITNIRYFLFTAPHLVSEPFFQSLSDEQKAILIRAATEAESFIWGYAEESEEHLTALMKQKGMLFSEPINEDGDWEAKARAVWPRLYFHVGGRQLVEAIDSLIDR